MPTTLVTGGAGFIGSHICSHLLKLGHSILCLDNLDPFYDINIKFKNLDRLKPFHNFSFIKSDIRDYESLEKLFSGSKIDFIFHAAAKAGVRPSIQAPAEYADVNIIGTINILECIKRFPTTNNIFCSSSSVYGNNPRVPFKEEDSDLHPISPYAASKLAMETFIFYYHDNYQIPATIIRPFTIYGPGQRPEMAIHYFTHLIETGEEVPQFGDGSMERDYTYIDDFCDGALAALVTPLGFEILNLGGSRTISLKKMVEILTIKLGKEAKTKIQPVPEGDVKKTFACIEKAEKLLGFKPKTSFEKGIELFVEWYRNLTN
ncbi:GDP-mannose 4,6-dehydratase [Candidatus Riflebacteria bacterium]